jgi:hypothetical protein
MRYRDRWEQWLRAEIESAPLPRGVDPITAWAVATMFSSYADSDGSNIEVSLTTLRCQLHIGKAKLDRTVQWLEDYGLLTITTKHGRRTATRRALALPIDKTGGS